MKTQDIFIAHPQTNEQVSTLKAFMQALKIKFEVSNGNDYNPEFVEKITRGREDIENRRFTDVKPENLKEFIDGL